MKIRNPRMLTVISAAAPISEQGEQWIDVVPTADKARNGRFYFTITRDDLDTFAASIAAQAGLVPVDYDHEGATGGSTVAAGWFTGETKIVEAGEMNPAGDTQDHTSLWAVVKWTPQAAQEIRDGRFKRISAENSFQERDAKTGLLTRAKDFIAATLTNRPFFAELAPLASADELLEETDVELLARVVDDGFRDVCAAALRSFDTQTREQMLAYLNTLDGQAVIDHKGDPVTDFAAIAKKLGLAEDATEEQVLAAIDAAAQTKPDPDPVPDGAVVLSKEQVDTLTANAAAGLAAKTELDALKVTTKLDTAVRQGKLTPAQRPSFETLASVDYTAFEQAIDALPEGAFKMAASGSGGDAPSTDDIDAPAPVTVDRTLYGVDEATHRVHVTAAKALKEAGKKPSSQDELLDALEQAGYDETVDRSRIQTAA